MDVQDRVALVTGAAVGTGRAIALRLAAEGAAVVVADLAEEEGRRTVALVEAAGGRASFVRVDLSRAEGVAELLDVAPAPDVLVNNAGGGAVLRPCFPEATPERWGAALDLNLRAPMLATQRVLEPMRERGGGVVVNIGSTAGLGYDWHVSPEYSAAKAGLIRLTATLAPLRESHRVRVNCVVPDWVRTERAERELAAMSPAERAATAEPVPLETLTDAVMTFVRRDDLAGAVMLLERERPPRLLGG
jgi:NAD(P)-dependent dehydrogenase (short-subunit alcohol dehydrogenase family)